MCVCVLLRKCAYRRFPVLYIASKPLYLSIPFCYSFSFELNLTFSIYCYNMKVYTYQVYCARNSGIIWLTKNWTVIKEILHYGLNDIKYILGKIYFISKMILL